MQNRKGGFTLVELMVVAVIVAILAAVAIPLMSANKKRAMTTEAQAGLGTLRTALRAMYAETSAYNVNLAGATIPNGSAPTALPGIGATDLDGKYFTTANYTLTTLGATTYTLTCVGGAGTDVAGVTVTLNDQGVFNITGL
jgi:prepilin-type N-terminal cleavage/methylation domain-containing protein